VNVRHVDGSAEGVARRGARAAARSICVRPALWWPAVLAATRLAPTGWWRRPPFLPVPDERYWRFRMETAYGDERAEPDAASLGEVLVWSRRGGPRRR